MRTPFLPLRKLTRARYDRIVDAGILGEDDKVELLDGLLVAGEPQGSRHAVVVGLVRAVLEPAFGRRRLLRRSSTVTPLGAPRARIRVGSLLP